MRKFLRIAGLCLMLVGCGNTMIIGDREYGTYGVANEDSMKNPNVEYEISAGSVICAILFVETVIVPVYVLGWDLMQPVGPKRADNRDKGVIR